MEKRAGGQRRRLRGKECERKEGRKEGTRVRVHKDEQSLEGEG